MINILPDRKILISQDEKKYLLNLLKDNDHIEDDNNLPWKPLSKAISDYVERLIKEKVIVRDKQKDPYNKMQLLTERIFRTALKEKLDKPSRHSSQAFDCIYIYLDDKSRYAYWVENKDLLTDHNIIIKINDNSAVKTCSECDVLASNEHIEISNEIKEIINQLGNELVWSESYFYALNELKKINTAFVRKRFDIPIDEYDIYIKYFFKCAERFIIGTSVPQYFPTWTDQCTYGKELIAINESLIEKRKGGVIRFFISDSKNGELTEEEEKILSYQCGKKIEIYVVFEEDYKKGNFKFEISDFDFSIFDGKNLNMTKFNLNKSIEPVKSSQFDCITPILDFYDERLKPLIISQYNLIEMYKFENDNLGILTKSERISLDKRLTMMIAKNEFFSKTHKF